MSLCSTRQFRWRDFVEVQGREGNCRTSRARVLPARPCQQRNASDSLSSSGALVACAAGVTLNRQFRGSRGSISVSSSGIH